MLGIGIIAVSVALVAAGVAAPASATTPISTAVARILADTNALRAANGKPPLVENTAVDAVSQAWANQLAQPGQTFDHNPNFFSQMPAGASSGGENIAGGFTYDTVVNQGWAKSAGHLANMLGNWTDIGIGYYESPDGSTTYLVQNFGYYPSHVEQPGADGGSTSSATPPSGSAGSTSPSGSAGSAPPSGLGEQSAPVSAPTAPYDPYGRLTGRASSSLVSALYQDVLGRAPDAGGKGYWTGAILNGAPVSYAVNGVLASTEYYVGRINSAYLSALGRYPDAGGLDYWLGQISSGRLPVDRVQMTLTESDEFYSRRGFGDPVQFVNVLYWTLLGRSPSGDEAQYWSRAVMIYGRPAVVSSIYNSTESAVRRIDALYETYFQRHADSSGIAYWMPFVIAQGDQSLRAQLVNSPEYVVNAVNRFPNG